MKRSHSRHGYPFDKLVPLMPKQEKIIFEQAGEIRSFYIGYNSIARKEAKRMHKKKQRQHDKKLENM